MGASSPFIVTGTKAAGKAPVMAAATGSPAWTDVATEAELTTHTADTTAVHGITDTAALITTATTLVGDVGGTVGATAIGALKVTAAMLATAVTDLLPSAGQKAALPGSSGTPSASNLYLTAADNSLRIRARVRLAAQGILDETFPAGPFNAYSSPGLSTIVGGLVAVLNGETITGAGVVVGTPNTVTSCWMSIYRATGGTFTRLALSADTPALVGTADSVSLWRRGKDGLVPLVHGVGDGTLSPTRDRIAFVLGGRVFVYRIAR